MKKFILILLIITLYLSTFNPILVKANNKYARIESTSEIYKTTSGSNTLDNIYCLAEESYFVEITAEYQEYVKVNYNGITGFMKKHDVKEISNTPSTPYPFNIKIKLSSNCNLRSTPTTNSQTNNIISTIYSNEEDIIFVGRTIGEEAIDFGGSTWYYVNYNGNYGYIYNNYVKSITPIYQNNENYTYISNKESLSNNPITHTPSLIIIILLSIPLFIMLFILYIPKTNHKSHHRKIKKTKTIEKY